MPVPYTFADHVGGAVPAQQLDDNFARLDASLPQTLVSFGAVGDGVTDDTAAVQAALTAGGALDGQALVYLVGHLDMATAGTKLRNFMFADAVISANSLLNITGTGCKVEDFIIEVEQSPTLTQTIRNQPDGTIIRNGKLIGPRWNMMLPHSSGAAIFPLQHILCRKADNSVQTGTLVENVVLIGGSVSVQAYNQNGCQYRNLIAEASYSTSFQLGTGTGSSNVTIENLWVLQPGQYGFTTGGQSTALTSYQGNRITAHTENCGWATWMTGINATGAGVGGTKGGYDFSGGGSVGWTARITTKNNAGFGMEYKGAISTVIPPGDRRSHFEVDYRTVYRQVCAYFLTDEGSTNPPTWMADCYAEGNIFWTAPTVWVAGSYFRPGDPVGDGAGFTWVCRGNSAGLAGTAGATIPTGGHAPATQVSSTDLTSGTASVDFVSVTGITAGDIAFIKTSAAVELLSVSTIVGNTVTFNGNASATVASGSTFIFCAKHNDGTLNWFCFESTPSIGLQGLEVRSSTNMVFKWNVYNCATAWVVNAIHSTTGAVTGLVIDGESLGCTTGLSLTGAGVIDVTLKQSYIQATTPVVIFSGAGARTVKWNPGPGAPVTKTADFTVDAVNVPYLCNKSGSDCTVTLPTASEWPGRRIPFVNYSASFSVVSASSNVIGIDGTGPSTSMLAPGMSGAVQSDGTNWVAVP